MQLTQKEKDLLKDLRNQEQLCIDKYTKHAGAANDPQLKQLFTDIANTERNHLDLINRIDAGETPAVPSGGQTQTPGFNAYYPGAGNDQKQADQYLCADLLATEKHVSGVYNTSIFEFGQTGLRDVLNHIQSDEQHHGDSIYKYMKTNGMCG
ncbi:MAG: ferritin-like domain-containing protein [Clostridia bacterium]|nr:ferritin-like domain-containing protein [Clostridia bacterium]